MAERNPGRGGSRIRHRAIDRPEAEQVDWTTDGTEIVAGDRQPDSYKQHQQLVNAGSVPSQKVIEDHIGQQGEDYRLESKVEHPVERFRPRDQVTR